MAEGQVAREATPAEIDAALASIAGQADTNAGAREAIAAGGEAPTGAHTEVAVELDIRLIPHNFMNVNNFLRSIFGRYTEWDFLARTDSDYFREYWYGPPQTGLPTTFDQYRERTGFAGLAVVEDENMLIVYRGNQFELFFEDYRVHPAVKPYLLSTDGGHVVSYKDIVANLMYSQPDSYVYGNFTAAHGTIPDDHHKCCISSHLYRLITESFSAEERRRFRGG